jgi:hypothetical protein
MVSRNESAPQMEPQLTIVDAPDVQASGDELFGRRKPPEKGRFRLQVDRQTKGSYLTREAAEQAGIAIKSSFPIVHVAVFDADEGQSFVIEVPTS